MTTPKRYTAHAGISAVFWGLQAGALAVLLLIAAACLYLWHSPWEGGGSLILSFSFPTGGPLAHMGSIVFWIAMASATAGTLATLAGKGLCLKAAQEIQAQPFVIGALVLQGIGVLSAWLPVSFVRTKAAGIPLYLIGVFLFLIFLRKLALSLQDLDLTRSAQWLLLLVSVIFALEVAIRVNLGGALTLVWLVLYLGIGLMALVRYSRLLWAMKHALIVETWPRPIGGPVGWAGGRATV